MHIYFTVTPEISNVYGNVFKNYEIINWIKYLKSETFTVLSKESIGLKSSLYFHVRYADFSQIVKGFTGIVTSYNHDVTITVVFKYEDVTVHCVSLLMII